MTAGSAAAAAVSIVPAVVIAAMRTGLAPPLSHRFCPASEYRYSSHRRAAAGCGAALLIAWL